MITSKDLIELFKKALYENWGYIWGKHGQLWTEAAQRSATDEKAIQYGSRWIGHTVADCSGLGYFAFHALGGYVFHGSNTMWNQYVTDRSELKNGKRVDGKSMLPGDPVFRKKLKDGEICRHHVGYYVGEYNGVPMVIEAKGTEDGVCTNVKGLFPDRANDGKGRGLESWHETAHWLNVDYGNGVYYQALPTLKKGASGDYVKEVQAKLNELGANLNVDGVFGSKTETAVMRFQQEHGLKQDGIVGRLTWNALGINIGSEVIDPVSQSDIPEAGTQDVLFDPEIFIWDHLLLSIGNPYGAAGVMGNLYAESGLKANNLQNNGNKALDMDDQTFTEAVDRGSYTREQFINDRYGYGIAQWTYPTRKQAMIDYAFQNERSIGDLDIQVEFLIKELKTYTSVWKVLVSAQSVRETSDAVMLHYEKPANQSEENKQRRAEFGQKFFDKYAIGTVTMPVDSASVIVQPKPIELVSLDVDILKKIYENASNLVNLLKPFVVNE